MRAAVLAVRHGPTAWNVVHRLQGRRDEPLSDQGRQMLSGLEIPGGYASFSWVSSPLQRCVESARLLGARELEIEPRLIEMDWGQWEGRTLAELREENPAEMRANEAGGLDFRPLGGESPREVGLRLTTWLVDVGQGGRKVVMLSHKGVLRALLSRAIGWDMRAKSPLKLKWDRAHLFAVSIAGEVRLKRPNIKLEGGPNG